MPKSSEIEILQKLCQQVSLREKPFLAIDYLILLLADYLNYQPVQRHFFLLLKHLRTLQKAVNGLQESKQAIITWCKKSIVYH